MAQATKLLALHMHWIHSIAVHWVHMPWVREWGRGGLLL